MNNKLLLTKEEIRNNTATEYSREQALEDDTGKTWGWGAINLPNMERQLQNTIDHYIYSFTSVVRKYS